MVEMNRRRFFTGAAIAGASATLLPRQAHAQAATGAYLPGDLRYYGAVPNSDVTTAFADAIASGYPVYLPAQLTGCALSSGVTVTKPVTVFGDGAGMSGLKLTGDFTAITVASNIQNCVFRDFMICGAGETGTVSAPAILYDNAAYNAISGMRILFTGIGVQYSPGSVAPYSCFLNSIRDSQILYQQVASVLGGKGTNALNLFNVTIGGGSTPYGVLMTDSNNLTMVGGCCGTVMQSGIALLNPTVKGAGCHKLTGISMEGTKSAQGDLLLGSASGYPVLGVDVDSITFDPGAGADSGANVINAYRVNIAGTVLSGYYGPGLTQGWLRVGAASKGVTAAVATGSGVLTYPVNS
jgi:hypothetical protein